MKTYAECRAEIVAKKNRMLAGKENWPIAERCSFECGVLEEIAVDLLYQVERLRDDSNTAEMHQLLERLSGSKNAEVKVTYDDSAKTGK